MLLPTLVELAARRYSRPVGTVFVLRAARFDGSPLGERRIASLPIRIGRNALNDCPLLDPGIAEFHALIEDSGGRLCVRDLNSAQGVAVRVPPQAFPARIPPGVPVDLKTGGFQFVLGNVALVSLFMEQNATVPPPRPPVQGAVLGNPHLLRGPGATLNLPRASAPGRRGRPSSVPPTLGMDATTTVSIPRVATPAPSPAPMPSATPGPAPLPAAVPAVRARPATLAIANYSSPPPPLPPDLRARALSPAPFPAAPPPLRSESPTPFQSPARAVGDANDGRTPVHTEYFSMPLESLALEAVRELAASLVPERHLETTGDLARFVTKLHDLAEVFCRSFVPLRDGHAQFISSLDLQRAAWQRGQQASASALAVEAARTPEAFALALLDFREQSSDAPKAVENIFADLMIHQVALLSGVMQGVRALLSELSPEAVEGAVGEPGGFGVDLGGGRSKAIWAAYRERYANLAEDDHALARIFGPEFGQAYREYRQREE